MDRREHRGDVDEPRGRWCVSQAVSKTGRGRWVHVPAPIFEAVLELVPRDNRAPERRVFQGFGGDRFRAAIARACTAAGVPAFSPTTCAIGVSPSCTFVAFRGPVSASSSGSATSP